MKTFISIIICCFLASIIYISCKKGITEKEKSSDNAISQEILQKIKDKGFSTKNVIRFKDGYLVEGDILLPASELDNIKTSATLRIANTEQYRTTNLVTGLPRVINISINNLSQTYIDALDITIARYGSLNLRLTFQRVFGTGDINIQGFYQAPNPDGSIVLGSSGFPANGNPFNSITLNTHPNALGNTPDLNYAASVLQHEIGHCMGFRHTDYMNRAFSCNGNPYNEGDGGIGAINIPGTPSGADADSWMLACTNPGTNRTFNYSDIIALQYLYGTPICSGNDRKMINGVCERGTYISDGGVRNGGTYICRYHYEFSDGSTKGPYSSSSSSPCPKNPD